MVSYCRYYCRGMVHNHRYYWREMVSQYLHYCREIVVYCRERGSRPARTNNASRSPFVASSCPMTKQPAQWSCFCPMATSNYRKCIPPLQFLAGSHPDIDQTCDPTANLSDQELSRSDTRSRNRLRPGARASSNPESPLSGNNRPSVF